HITRSHRYPHSLPTRRSSDLGPTDDATRRAQSVERLRRGDFVNEMQVNVEQRRLARRFADDVIVPEFVEESSHKKRGRRSEVGRSEEHTSELQSPYDLVCRLL